MQQDNPTPFKRCLVLNCQSTKERQSRGLCPAHYTAWLKLGKPEQIEGYTPVRSHNPNGIKVCIAPGCELPYYHKGLCNMHSKRWVNAGRPEPILDNLKALELSERDTTCTAKGCNRTILCRGLCRNHYRTGRGEAGSYNSDRMAGWKMQLVAARGGKCERCGFKTHVMGCYHFHHRDPSKKSRSIVECKTLEQMQKEAEKCALLCGNCHPIVHWEAKEKAKGTLNQTSPFPDS